MTVVSDEAQRFINELLMDDATPDEIRDRVWERLGEEKPGGKKQAIRAAILIVKDDTKPLPARLAALDKVVDVFKGDA